MNIATTWKKVKTESERRKE